MAAVVSFAPEQMIRMSQTCGGLGYHMIVTDDNRDMPVTRVCSLYEKLASLESEYFIEWTDYRIIFEGLYPN